MGLAIAKATIGVLSNILYFNVFSASTIVLIKKITLIQGLNPLLSFSMNSKIHDEFHRGKDASQLFSSFLAFKILIGAIVFTIFILSQILQQPIFDSSLLLILFLILIFVNIMNDLFSAICYSYGKLKILVKINTYKTLFIPIAYYLFGEKYQLSAWLWTILVFDILQCIYLLRKFLDLPLKLEPSRARLQEITSLLRGTLHFHLTYKFDFCLQAIIFFIVLEAVGAEQAALIAFLLRANAMIIKPLGQTLTKKFTFDMLALSASKPKEWGELCKQIDSYILLSNFIISLYLIIYMSISLIFMQNFMSVVWLIPLLLPYGVSFLFNKNICRIMLGWGNLGLMRSVFLGSAAIFLGVAVALFSWAPSPEQLLLILIVGSVARSVFYFLIASITQKSFPPLCSLLMLLGQSALVVVLVAISKMAELSPLDEATLMLGSIGLATASLVVSVPEVFRFVRRELKISKVFV